MNSEGGLLGFYRNRLMRRELTLLSHYRQNGRQPRMAQLAYWRVSFIPLVVPLIYFACLRIGFTDGQATASAISLAVGLVLADAQLFVMNAGAWIFAKQTLRWARVAEMKHAFDGSMPPDLTKQGKENQWDKVEVPKSYLQSVANTYLAMRNDPPTVQKILTQSPEMRTLLLSTAILAVIMAVSSEMIFFALPIYLFLIAWPVKRVKTALDFWVTWPELQRAFDWEKISELSKGRPTLK